MDVFAHVANTQTDWGHTGAKVQMRAPPHKHQNSFLEMAHDEMSEAFSTKKRVEKNTYFIIISYQCLDMQESIQVFVCLFVLKLSVKKCPEYYYREFCLEKWTKQQKYFA